MLHINLRKFSYSFHLQTMAHLKIYVNTKLDSVHSCRLIQSLCTGFDTRVMVLWSSCSVLWLLGFVNSMMVSRYCYIGGVSVTAVVSILL